MPRVEPPRTAGPVASAAPLDGSILLVLVVAVAALYLAREVLIPITAAVLLSFGLAPLVGLLRRTGLGRAPSVLLAVMLALMLVVGVGGVIAAQVADLAQVFPRYANTLEHKFAAVRGETIGRLDTLIQNVGHRFENSGPGGAQPAVAAQDGAPSSGPKPVPVVVEQSGPTPMELAGRYLTPALSPVATLGIVFVVAIFILLQREDLRDRLIRLVGAGDLHRTTLALDEGGRRLSRYFLTQMAVNVGFGIIIGIGLFFIGVPSPVLWGMLSALLRFVPYVGSVLAAFFPLALAAAVDPGWSMAIETAALYLVVEPLVGQGIEPMLYGHSTGLSPIAVVISAIFWSWIWGPVGLVMSMPLTLCLVVLGRHVRRLEFLDVMLGDRPALTPVESFYQRLLAGDEDEARDHAEGQLKERTRASYYDEVALPGLRLALADARRGILNAEQLDRIGELVGEVIADLADRDDGVPSTDAVEDAADARVLCIAGRGPLDGLAAAMLAQLLATQGLGVRLVPHTATARDRIHEIDASGITMICLAYVELHGQPAHLRALVGRLRNQMPGLPMLVGFAIADDQSASDAGRRPEAAAAVATAGSLREAVDACVAAARLPRARVPARAEQDARAPARA